MKYLLILSLFLFSCEKETTEPTKINTTPVTKRHFFVQYWGDSGTTQQIKIVIYSDTTAYYEKGVLIMNHNSKIGDTIRINKVFNKKICLNYPASESHFLEVMGKVSVDTLDLTNYPHPVFIRLFMGGVRGFHNTLRSNRGFWAPVCN